MLRALDVHDLVIRASPDGAVSIAPEDVGWRYVGFQARRLRAGEIWRGTLAADEGLFLVLGGVVTMRSPAGEWPSFGRRANVFGGDTHALYLPVGADFALTAETDAELALCLARASERMAPRLIGPGDYAVETRGEGNCERTIRHILPPAFPARRLLAVEVYTPSGNWSSYPPHKHDTEDGLREAALEEIYCHRQSDRRGFALQRLYGKDGLLEVATTVFDGDLMLIPRGYHGPVAQAPGYDGYYLNVLAGDRRTMAFYDDPDHGWIRERWDAERRGETRRTYAAEATSSPHPSATRRDSAAGS